MVDHILIGAPDLQTGIDYIFQKTKLHAPLGGLHPLWNTQNALLSLGSDSYLEIIAPQPGVTPKKPFKILSELNHPQLITWAARTTDIFAIDHQMSSLQLAHSGVLPGSRLKANGTLLQWKILFPENNYSGVFPFFIEWDKGNQHPAQALEPGLILNKLLLYHDQAKFINECFNALQLEISCQYEEAPKLIMELDTPSGKMVL